VEYAYSKQSKKISYLSNHLPFCHDGLLSNLSCSKLGPPRSVLKGLDGLVETKVLFSPSVHLSPAIRRIIRCGICLRQTITKISHLSEHLPEVPESNWDLVKTPLSGAAMPLFPFVLVTSVTYINLQFISVLSDMTT